MARARCSDGLALHDRSHVMVQDGLHRAGASSLPVGGVGGLITLDVLERATARRGGSVRLARRQLGDSIGNVAYASDWCAGSLRTQAVATYFRHQRPFPDT